MKKHLSVFMLQLTAPLDRILIRLVLMSGIQLFIPFACAMGLFENIPFFKSGNALNIRNIFRIEYIVFYCFLLLFSEIFRGGLSRKNCFDYTVQRLGISERAFYWWNVLSILLYFLLIWAFEACTLYGVMKILAASGAIASSNLSFYFVSIQYGMISAFFPIKNKLLRWVIILAVLIVSLIDADQAQSARRNFLSENGGQ